MAEGNGYVTTREVQQFLGVSRSWLQLREDQGQLVEGIHFVRIGDRFKRWNQALVQHWFQNQHNPAAYEAKCREYLESIERAA